MAARRSPENVPLVGGAGPGDEQGGGDRLAPALAIGAVAAALLGSVVVVLRRRLFTPRPRATVEPHEACATHAPRTLRAPPRSAAAEEARLEKLLARTKRASVQVGIVDADQQIVDLGSGTLVRSGGRTCVLTAAHLLIAPHSFTLDYKITAGCRILIGLNEHDDRPTRWSYTATVTTPLDALRSRFTLSGGDNMLLDLAVLDITGRVECDPPLCSGAIGGLVHTMPLGGDAHAGLPQGLELGDQIRTGEDVLLVGFPAQIHNVISVSKASLVNTAGGYCQTDAHAESGSSGGALVSLSTGCVIGVMSQGGGHVGEQRAQELAKARSTKYLTPRHHVLAAV